MKAVVISTPGAADVLEVRTVADPEPGPGDVLVRVRATAVNRADILQRQGRYPAPAGAPSDIPGLEFAGTVEALGEGVRGWALDERVMGLAGGGAYAQRVVVPADHLVPVPEALSFQEAAAVPEVFITAHDALRIRLKVQPGETVLVHAVGSGVGTAGLQLAHAWGATVIGTARTGWKLDRARGYGLDTALHLPSSPPGVRPAFADAVLDVTGGRGVDAVLDLVGGSYLPDTIRSLATLGRAVVVGLTAGRSAELDLGALLSKRLTLVGTVLRSRSGEEKAAATRAFVEDVVPLLERGRVEPVIHEVLPVAEAARAHALVESNQTFGKVVLSW